MIIVVIIMTMSWLDNKCVLTFVSYNNDLGGLHDVVVVAHRAEGGLQARHAQRDGLLLLCMYDCLNVVLLVLFLCT